jgi:hypothetical protein
LSDRAGEEHFVRERFVAPHSPLLE